MKDKLEEFEKNSSSKPEGSQYSYYLDESFTVNTAGEHEHEYDNISTPKGVGD